MALEKNFFFYSEFSIYLVHEVDINIDIFKGSKVQVELI